MSKDISTIFTKEKNERCGRKGYFGLKREKETVITPKIMGCFYRKGSTRNEIKYASEKL